MVRNDDAEAFGETRDDREEVHLPVEAPSVDEDERRVRRIAGLADEELAFVDEHGPPRDVERAALLPLVGGLRLRAEESPHDPRQTEAAEDLHEQTHTGRLGVGRRPATRCGTAVRPRVRVPCRSMAFIRLTAYAHGSG